MPSTPSNISKGIVLMLLFFVDQLQAQSPKEITNSIGMKLVLIPKGTFMMGSPETEKGRQENETQHEVTISKDYYLGVHEVTQAQYETVMGKNPSHFQGAIVGNRMQISLWRMFHGTMRSCFAKSYRTCLRR